MSELQPSGAPLVLVVEDDPDHRDLLAWACASAGAEPVPVADAAGADAFLAGPLGASVALFVLDRRLPGHDGLTLCRDLRLDPRHAATPVLVVSAAAGPAAAGEALAAGADAYVTKPFPLADLRSHVRSLLSAHIGVIAPAEPSGGVTAARFAHYATLAAASGAAAAPAHAAATTPAAAPLRRGA